MNIYTYKDGKFYISGKLCFKFWAQFGVPIEVFVEMVNDAMNKDLDLKIQHLKRAYDLSTQR